MAIKFEKIKVGDVLLDIHSERMGNTTMRELGCWQVRIISIDTTTRTARVSWNGNPEKTYRERDLTRLHTKETAAYRRQEAARAAWHATRKDRC